MKDHQEKLKNLSSDLEVSKKVHQKSEEKLKGLLKEISELENELDQAECDYESLDKACKYDLFLSCHIMLRCVVSCCDVSCCVCAVLCCGGVFVVFVFVL